MATIDTDVDLQHVLAEAEEAARPDEPSLPLGEWLRKNLFSSWFNSILTVVFVAIGLVAYRGLLNFIFSEERQWDAVRVNLRGLFTFAYPSAQYGRVWFSLGVLAVLGGLSLGLMKVGRGIPLKRMCMWFISWGTLIVLGVLLRQPSALKDDLGQVRFADADGVELVTNAQGTLEYANGDPAPSEGLAPIRESFGDAMGDRAGWWAIGLILLAIGLGAWYALGDQRRRHTYVPSIPLTLGGIGLLISSLWWYKWGHYGTNADGLVIDPDSRVASSTRDSWTIIWFVLVAAYLVGRRIVDTERAGLVRALVNVAWLLSPFILFFVVLRDPALDWDHVWSTDLPMALGFIVIGGAILWALTRPGIGEIGRVIATVAIAFALFNWVAAFFGWYPMLQKARFSFLLFGLAALLAPNFIGDAKQRLRLVYGWTALMIVFHYLVTMINTPATVESPTEEFAGGFMVTLFVATFTMIFSFPLGVLLALGRTSKMPLFRIISTVYIETIRGVPLITMLFFFATFVTLFLPDGMHLSSLAAVTIAFTVFSAAYLAENIRGGLQSVRRGQYEASDAVGLTTVQRTMFIVLPQGLRVSIPPLVGQVIATFKETSLLAIIGVFDFLRIANSAIPGQPDFLGVKREGLLFVSAVYWIGAYSMSKYSQRLERQLGVGER